METNLISDSDLDDEADVAWARRKEVINGTVRMFRVVLDAVRRHAEWVEKRYGLSAAQLWTLWELAHTPGMRVADLAKTLSIPRATADALLNALIVRGLVRDHAPAPSSSTRLYFVTYDGQRIAQDSPQFGQGVLKAALGQLPDTTLAVLSDAFSELIEQLPFRENSAALHPMAEQIHAARNAAPTALLQP